MPTPHFSSCHTSNMYRFIALLCASLACIMAAIVCGPEVLRSFVLYEPSRLAGKCSTACSGKLTGESNVECDRTHTTCRFTNVGLTQNKQIIFYANQSSMLYPPGFLWNIQSGDIPLGRTALTARLTSKLFRKFAEVCLEYACDPPPLHTAEWITTPSVLLRPNAPENFGHFLYDELYAAWATMRTFDRHAGIDIVSVESCDEHYALPSEASQLSRCRRFTETMPSLFIGGRYRAGLPKGTEHYRTLYVGTRGASTECTFDSSHWASFQAATYRRLDHNQNHLSWPAKRGDSLAIVLVKGAGLHKRNIANSDDVVAALKTRYMVVEKIQPDLLTITQQLFWIRRASLIVAPGGGVAMLDGFAHEEACVIHLDQWSRGYSSNMDAPIFINHKFRFARYTVSPSDLKFYRGGTYDFIVNTTRLLALAKECRRSRANAPAFPCGQE